METIYLIIGGIVTGLAGVWAVFSRGKSAGRNEAEGRYKDRIQQREKKANEASAKANDSANSNSDDDNRQWLRDNAGRDNKRN